MCGLVGIIDREKSVFTSAKMVKAFSQMLYADALRGRHGTGILSVNKIGDVFKFKRALDASDFLKLEVADTLINKVDHMFLMGHNRWATHGAHTTENAHPFRNEHIYLFHNGTLTNHHSLTHGKRFTVDSNALSYHLSQSTDLKETLEKVEGAYSLVWYNEFDQTINFARNKDRPMYIAKVKDSESMLYASEKGMLEWIASRNDLKIDEALELPTGVILTIPLDNSIAPSKILFKPYEDPYEGYYRNSYQGDYYGRRQVTVIRDYENPLTGIASGTVVSIEGLSWECFYDQYPEKPEDYGYIKHVKDGIEYRLTSIQRKNADYYVGSTNHLVVGQSTNPKLCFCRLANAEEVVAATAKKEKPRYKIAYYTKDMYTRTINCGCSECLTTLRWKDGFFTKSASDSSVILCETCANEHPNFSTLIKCVA